MMRKFLLLFHTIKFLKSIQIYYRLFYFIRKKFRRLTNFKYPLMRKSQVLSLVLKPSIDTNLSYMGDNKFSFLNIKHDFKKNINWNYGEYGKLWTYNLNYFDFLNQKSSANYLDIIEDFIHKQEKNIVGFESFPIALRGINWIKYLTYNNIRNQKINDSLYAQYDILRDNIEYHLLGNHLLENAFSLLFAAYYFQDEKFYLRAKKILENELNEQILEDGAHFELSPMYHQIMLFRILDSINLLENNEWKKDKLLSILIEKSELMLGWLEQVTYKNGDIPLLNDSSRGIAPKTEQLKVYAKSLDIKSLMLPLKSSGYRKVIKNNYEVIVDVGSIGATYIPGHAHSDTLSFEVYKNNKPFIVDTGLSTYETNERRMIERSTASHNTVEVEGSNQSEVWGGFRVAKRANIIYLKEEENSIEAIHDGYKVKNIFHHRKWIFKENKIILEDILDKSISSRAYLHFYPNITKKDIQNSIIVDSDSIEIVQYEYAMAFNCLVQAWCMRINFTNTLKIEININ